MRYAIISNGVVGVPRPEREKDAGSEAIPDYVTLGDTRSSDGLTFYRDGVELKLPVPETVPLWAFRASLVLAGITEATVDALINGLPNPDKTVATIQWNYGNFIDREHRLINSLGNQLALSKEQIDAIFIQAVALS